jgi:Icc protein
MPAPRILHVTDTHLFATERRALRGVVTQSTFERALARALRHDWPPDAIVLTGDLVHDESRAGYERLRARMAALGPPVYCITGNHDDPDIAREVLGAPPFQYAGSFLAGGWCVVLIETQVRGQDVGAVDEDGLMRLDATLRAHPDLHGLVCLHHHPVAIGSEWLDSLGIVNGEALLEVVGRHDNARALLWGHVHQVFDEQVGALRLLSTPSTCMQFKPRSKRFRYDTLPPASRWLTLHDDGTIATEVLWADD